MLVPHATYNSNPMTRNYDTAIVAAVLTTLAEMPEGYVDREGILYAPFMDRGLDTFQQSIAVCVQAGYLERRPNFGLVLTAAGREMAKVIEDHLAQKAK